MNFSVGDILSIDSEGYRVIGKIHYDDLYNNSSWDEYRVIRLEDNSEAWLSVDDTYREYSISRMVRTVNKNGYHEVDRGRQCVGYATGSVDVERGDTASFVEYEDPTEEKIISEEIWEDGTEYSEGYYLDEDEISFIRHDDQYRAPVSRPTVGGSKAVLLTVLALAIMVVPMLGAVLENIHFTSSISRYLKKDASYTYVTSITGRDKQKADVYKAPSGFTIDQTTKDIIRAIEGNTEYVQQDTEDEDGSVGILTQNEYALVYTSEDGDVLVQVSNRKYAYTSDNDLYRGTHRSRRYYRRFYYSTGYSYDSNTYSSSSSPYSSFDDSGIGYSSDNSYNSYSGSVRQESVNSRRSSGGGLSSGK